MDVYSTLFGLLIQKNSSLFFPKPLMHWSYPMVKMQLSFFITSKIWIMPNLCRPFFLLPSRLNSHFYLQVDGALKSSSEPSESPAWKARSSESCTSRVFIHTSTSDVKFTEVKSLMIWLMTNQGYSRSCLAWSTTQILMVLSVLLVISWLTLSM